MSINFIYVIQCDLIVSYDMRYIYYNVSAMNYIHCNVSAMNYIHCNVCEMN